MVATLGTVRKGKERRAGLEEQIGQAWQSVSDALTCVLNWIYSDRRGGQV